jgi:tetratricopeptide (TPR) repeat protein
MHPFAPVLAAALLAQSTAGPSGLASPTTAPSASPAPSATPSGPMTQAHFTVSTTVADAQTAFDHGLTLLYAFNQQEARRAFERAATLDPKLAMAQWGIAMSYGIDLNTSYQTASQLQGRAAIKRAQALAATTTPLEHALIDATVPRYNFTAADDSDRSAHAYAVAMAKVAIAFPNDPTALVLTAESAMDNEWDFWTKDGKPQPGTENTIALLRAALARDPSNIGANHFLIHMLEGSPHPQDALGAAQILMDDPFEPAAEHLVHMPAHIFMRVGDYHAAGEANRLAVEHFEAYLRTAPPSGHEHYLGHDLVFETDAYMMSGEFAAARHAADEFTADVHIASHLLDNVFVRFNRCDLVTATSGFAVGFCGARAGHTAPATKIAKDIRSVGSNMTTIPADIIDAQLAENRGDTAAASALLQHAIGVQDNFPYDEPPAWFFPIRERLGALYYRAGKFDDAERTFRDDLLANPKNPRSLFGLAQTLDQEGKLAEAADVQKEFEQAWVHADASLTMKDL